MRIFAYTGSAAFNSGGITLHRGLSLGLTYRKHAPEKYIQFPAERMKGVRLIIIDEAFLVGVAFLGYMERRLRAIFHSDEPFGGVTLLLTGDLGQKVSTYLNSNPTTFYLVFLLSARLTPIGDRRLFYKSPSDEGHVLEGIHAYAKFDKCIILREILRQDASQALFKGILSNLRTGTLTEEDVRTLKARHIDVLMPSLSDEQLDAFLSAPVIYADNASVDEYNL